MLVAFCMICNVSSDMRRAPIKMACSCHLSSILTGHTKVPVIRLNHKPRLCLWQSGSCNPALMSLVIQQCNTTLNCVSNVSFCTVSRATAFSLGWSHATVEVKHMIGVVGAQRSSMLR